MKKSNFTNSLVFFFFRTILLSSFILVLLKVNAFAFIDSIEIVPSSPSEQDQITINVHGMFYDGCWSPGNSTFSQVGNTFNIEMTATDSWQPEYPCLQVIVHYFLTYTVGPLDTGKYMIKMVENHISLRHPDPDFSTLPFNVLPLLKVIHVPADAPTIQGELI